MQTILGSGGAIGIEQAKTLREFTDEISVVSPLPYLDGIAEIVNADYRASSI